MSVVTESGDLPAGDDGDGAVLAILVTWIEGHMSLPQLVHHLNGMTTAQRRHAERLLQALGRGIAADSSQLAAEIAEAVRHLE
jgi:hypothetical protein